MYMVNHYTDHLTTKLTAMIFDNLIHSSNKSIESTQDLICTLESQLEAARQELADKQQDFQVKLTAQSAGDTALTLLEEAMQKVFAAFGQSGIDEMCEKVLDIATATLNAPKTPLILTAATDSDPEAPTPEPAPAAPSSEVTPIDEVIDATFQPTNHIIVTGNSAAPKAKDKPVENEILPKPTDQDLEDMSTHDMYRYAEAYGIWARYTPNMRNMIKKHLMGNYYLNPAKILPLPVIEEVPNMKRTDILKYADQCGFTVRSVSDMKKDLINEIRAQQAYAISLS